MDIFKWAGVVIALGCSGGVQGFAGSRWDPVPADQREPLQYRPRKPLPGAPIGQAEKLIGTPRAERRNQEGRMVKPRLSLAADVFEQDRFITEPETRIHIRCIDKTYLEIGSDSIFQIERIRRGGDRKEESIFRFTSGLVRVTAASVEDWVHFYVKNLDRILAVEGPSDLYLAQNPRSRELFVHVRKGKVFLISAIHGKRNQVPEGESRMVRPDGRVKVVPSMSAEQWERLKSQTAIKNPNPQASAEAGSGG